MHRDDDFLPHAHSHLADLYGSTELAARLVYEERLRHASAMHRVLLHADPRPPRVSLIAQIGAALVRWGERLQAAGAALPAGAGEHAVNVRM